MWSDFAKETEAYSGALAAFSSGSAFKATDFYENHADSIRQVDSSISKALEEYSKVETL